MKTANRKTLTAILLASLAPVLLGGCGELMLSPVYSSALGGALLGAIIGHQSGETGEGAALGAAICGVGALLAQTDELARKKKEAKEEDESNQRTEADGQKVIIKITNSNGSTTDVELTKKGCAYIGPNGEQYDQLPTEEQLKPIYGF
ncbi:MAG: hypothetical protein ACYTBJ_05915 [Planctomycetota bacterium]